MAMMACNSGADVVDDGGDGCLTENRGYRDSTDVEVVTGLPL